MADGNPTLGERLVFVEQMGEILLRGGGGFLTVSSVTHLYNDQLKNTTHSFTPTSIHYMCV